MIVAETMFTLLLGNFGFFPACNSPEAMSTTLNQHQPAFSASQVWGFFSTSWCTSASTVGEY